MKEAEVNSINTDDSIITKRINGTVIHINSKGYGFINSPSVPFTRIFFHWQSLHHTINIMDMHEGDKVSFELRKNDDGGFRAIRVDLI